MKSLKYLLILLVAANTAYASEEISKISVTGESKITLDAQYSIIHTEVKHVSKDVDKSYQDLQQSLKAIINDLKDIGLSDQKITKSIVSQGSEYTWQNNSRKHLGYYSVCNMALRINNLQRLPEIYHALSKYDAVTINQTEYGRNDQFEKRNEELKNALGAAKQKAELMAQSLGVKLGAVHRIQELNAQSVVTENVYKTKLGGEGGLGTFGSVDIIATVLIEFHLE